MKSTPATYLLVLSLALTMRPIIGAQIPPTTRFDWGEINRIAWPDVSIVVADGAPPNEALNTPEVMSQMRAAAERGSAPAQFNLGRAYEHGNGVLPDFEQAHAWYLEAAEKRYAAAEFSVGMDYARGVDVQQDDEEAVRWIRRAAAQGHARGQYSLGMAYALGIGTERDPRGSIPWFQRAADQGVPEAQLKFGLMSIAFSGLLGTGTGTGVGTAVASLQKAAEHGLGEAQFALGMIYMQGSPLSNPDTNFVQDFVESYKWFTICWKRTTGNLQSSCGARRFEVERKMTSDAIGDAEDRTLEWINK